MKMRPYIERLISGLVNHNGAREAKFVGAKKVDYQMKMAATCYNLKRWVARLLHSQSSKKEVEQANVVTFGRSGYKLPAPQPVTA